MYQYPIIDWGAYWGEKAPNNTHKYDNTKQKYQKQKTPWRGIEPRSPV